VTRSTKVVEEEPIVDEARLEDGESGDDAERLEKHGDVRGQGSLRLCGRRRDDFYRAVCGCRDAFISFGCSPHVEVEHVRARLRLLRRGEAEKDRGPFVWLEGDLQ
jgi:hypothetical protein